MLNNNNDIVWEKPWQGVNYTAQSCQKFSWNLLIARYTLTTLLLFYTKDILDNMLVIFSSKLQNKLA